MFSHCELDHSHPLFQSSTLYLIHEDETFLVLFNKKSALMEELYFTFRSRFILYGHVFGLEHGKCLWTPKYCTCKSAYNNFQGPFNFHNVIRKMFSHMLSFPVYQRSDIYASMYCVYMRRERGDNGLFNLLVPKIL